MKVTFDISPSEMAEIQRITGECRKGRAIRKMVVDALMLKRREKLSQKFLSGEWGVELAGMGKSQEANRRSAKVKGGKWNQ